MSVELVTLIATAFWESLGAGLIGLFFLGVLFYFFVVNRVDRGGLALLGLLVLGYMARPAISGGFGMIDVWIYYVVLAAIGLLAALGFINSQREA